jgi:hypothetical protein
MGVCLWPYIYIQHAEPMRRVTLPSVVCPALQYFSTYLINGAIEKILNIKCVLICSKTLV